MCTTPPVLVGDRDDTNTGLGQEPCGIAADLAEALHRRGGSVDPDPARPQGLAAQRARRRATVAVARPSEPPTATGLPVVTPRTVWPCCTE